MIRRPTSSAAAYAWHRAAIADGNDRLEITVTGEPECGWFKRKLVKGGPFVPARIWLDQWIDEATGELLDDERLQCEVNGQYADAEEQWPWLCGNVITEAEYNYLTARNAYAAWYSPDEPAANPRQAIDWLKVPTPSFT